MLLFLYCEKNPYSHKHDTGAVMAMTCILYLAFIELLTSFLGSSPILTGCHMALQCAIPCKSLMTIWTLIRFFTYRWPQKVK